MSVGVIGAVFAKTDFVLLMQLPTLPSVKKRVPLAFASDTNAVQTAIRSVLQASLSVTQRSLTWHSASAFWLQKSVSVSGLRLPPPPQPASNPVIAAARTSFRIVICNPPIGKGAVLPSLRRRSRGAAHAPCLPN